MEIGKKSNNAYLYGLIINIEGMKKKIEALLKRLQIAVRHNPAEVVLSVLFCCFGCALYETSWARLAVVGLTFVGTVAQFVVVNEYMDTIVDMNKNPEGIESEIVGENEVTELEARKALAFLKLKMRKYGK